MNTRQEIQAAKQLLKNNGYFVDNLWQIADIQDKFECTNEQAYNILGKALTNEETMNQIQFSIRDFAELECLLKKDD